MLDVLAGRKTVGRMTGEILFGGVKPTKMFLRRYTGYVEQFDTLIPILTVEEMIRYTAELKLDIATPPEEKARAVQHVIDTLALDTCRNTLIGSSEQRGISGGQAKRTNIGIALVSSPNVLFLDEPTTGLDSYTSNEVMAAVKNLATSGITCVATIHSPTPFAFSLFDRVMLLLRGEVVYFGRNGQQAIDYVLSAAGDVSTTVLFNEKNPAEWITDVTVVADRNGLGHELAEKYNASDLRKHADEELEVQLKETRDLPPEIAAQLAVNKETTTPTLYAFKTLVKYRMLRNYSTFAFYASRAMPWIIQTCIIFSVFWGIGRDVNQSTVINIVAVIFFFIMAPAFSAASFVPQIMLSRPLYFRERNDGLFRPICFLMYLMAEECLVAIPVSFIVCTAMWFGVGLAGSYITWWLQFYLQFLCGVSSAYFLAALSPNIDTANALVPIYGVICMFFAGFLIIRTDMPWYWRWLMYATPTFYGVSGQVQNFFSGDRDIIFLNNQTVSNYYGVHLFSVWGYTGMQVIFPVVFSFLAWLALSYKTNVKR